MLSIQDLLGLINSFSVCWHPQNKFMRFLLGLLDSTDKVLKNWQLDIIEAPIHEDRLSLYTIFLWFLFLELCTFLHAVLAFSWLHLYIFHFVDVNVNDILLLMSGCTCSLLVIGKCYNCYIDLLIPICYFDLFFSLILHFEISWDYSQS